VTGRAPRAERAFGDDYVWFAGSGRERDPGTGDDRGPGGPAPSEPQPAPSAQEPAPSAHETPPSAEAAASSAEGSAPAKDAAASGSRPAGRNRLELEPDTVERDLVKLVLTVVELLRQLMERQAVRRFDTGDLSEDQEERIGLTLMLLDERMAELRDRYGLRPEDLNLDLGPLGPLLPRD
jgi:hypothetical protein